jgi:hypothetical protein
MLASSWTISHASWPSSRFLQFWSRQRFEPRPGKPFAAAERARRRHGGCGNRAWLWLRSGQGNLPSMRRERTQNPQRDSVIREPFEETSNGSYAEGETGAAPSVSLFTAIGAPLERDRRRGKWCASRSELAGSRQIARWQNASFYPPPLFSVV